MGRARIDLTGQRFGRWNVLKKAEPKHYVCTCDCGAEKIVRQDGLRSGRTQSCGCLAKDIQRERHLKHGLSGVPEYHIWESMKDRCLNANNKYYNHYGGRGIKISKEWISNFEIFYKDMGSRPSKNHSIDRIDNDKGYFKKNCRWSTKSQQAYNRRKKEGTTSRYYGVDYSLEKRKWRARISKDKIKYNIGWFKTEIEAAKAYKKMAKKLYGKFAIIN